MPEATITQCAILTGGLGTRLGALTANTPKPLLPCGDRPFLAWLLREFVRYGVTDFLLLTGHLSEQIEAAVPALLATLPRNARIEISREPIRAGTGGALVHARDRLADHFLMCNGDSLFDANLSNLLADAATDSNDTIGRMLLRRQPDGSRYGAVSLDGDRVTGFQERGASGVINAGVYVFRKALLDHLQPACSLEADVMPALAAQGALRGTEGEGYFRDIGVPEDFAAAQTEIPALLHRKTLFLDRDGVINLDHGYVGTRDRFDWVDGAREAIRLATQSGWHVFIVTNQSGVARGFYTEDDVHALLTWIADEARAAGGTIDDARYCPYHPAAPLEAYRQSHPWRKPQPGMLQDLIRAWNVDPARAVMIGDLDTDMQAAAAAGVTGYQFHGGNLRDFLAPILHRHQ